MGTATMVTEIQELIDSDKLRPLQYDLLLNLKNDDDDNGPKFDVYQISEHVPPKLIGRHMGYSAASQLCDEINYHRDSIGTVIVPHAFDYLRYVLKESVGIMQRANA